APEARTRRPGRPGAAAGGATPRPARCASLVQSWLDYSTRNGAFSYREMAELGARKAAQASCLSPSAAGGRLPMAGRGLFPARGLVPDGARAGARERARRPGLDLVGPRAHRHAQVPLA